MAQTVNLRPLEDSIKLAWSGPLFYAEDYGDECKAVERQVFQACLSEFESRHPCQNYGERGREGRREIVTLVNVGSIPSVHPVNSHCSRMV